MKTVDWFRRRFEAIASRGIDENTPRTDEKHIRLLNVMFAVVLAFLVVGIQNSLWSWIIGKYGHWPAWFVLPLLSMIVLLLLGLWFSGRGGHYQARSIAIIVTLWAAISTPLLEGPQPATLVLLVGLIPVLYFVFPEREHFRRNAAIVALVVIVLVTHIFVKRSPVM